MATINGILEGKTGNYFKFEDFGEDIFTIIESIDPAKTEIRSEKVKNKEVKADGKAETEYYHILCRCGDIEKDLSLTFTALKQLAGILPKNENWRGYQGKYLGTKGSNKNIKYNFQIMGKNIQEQGRLTDAPSDSPITKILTSLKDGSKWFPDGIPLANVNQAIQAGGFTGAGTDEMLKSLKDKGLILETTAGLFKVV